MREIDRRAIEDYGIPGRELMERAGIAVSAEVSALLESTGLHGPVVVLAGPGNNGGDALVSARYLRGAGIEVRIWLLASPERMGAETAANLERLRAGGGNWKLLDEDGFPECIEDLSSASLAVDGIFGTGFRGGMEGMSARAVLLLDELGTAAVAIDIPSGLDGETGSVSGPAVRALKTVTMGLPKTGLFRGSGLEYAGAVTVADIGLPPELVETVETPVEMLIPSDVAPFLPPRSRISHKGDYGKVLIVAGSPGMTGAAILASRAALRSGAGLVTVACPRSLVPTVAAGTAEVMTLPLPEGEDGAVSPDAGGPVLEFLAAADAAVVGPGLSRGPGPARLTADLIAASPVPLILDADALAVVARDRSLLSRAASPLVLTPHPGEMARLDGTSAAEVNADREGIARRFAAEHGVTLVLKGAGTVVAPPAGPVMVNPTGNPGMATAGSGDVLAGMVGAFIGQGMSAAAAAVTGVFLHGLAGDIAVSAVGERAMIASDIIARIPAAFESLGAV